MEADAIKGLVTASATEAELELIILYLDLNNFFRALSTRPRGEVRLPRLALERYGLDKQLSFALQSLTGFQRWTSCPSWVEFNQSRAEVAEHWELCLRVGSATPDQTWESLKRAYHTRSVRQMPIPYTIADFLNEVPEYDRRFEQQHSEVEDRHFRKFLISSDI